MRRPYPLLAAVPLVLMLTACSHKTDHLAMTSTSVNGGTGYVPTEIVANKEETMYIKVGNGTGVVHGFAIDGYKVKTTVAPNQTVLVKFHLGRAGTFRIYCQLHPAHQTATLIVR